MPVVSSGGLDNGNSIAFGLAKTCRDSASTADAWTPVIDAGTAVQRSIRHAPWTTSVIALAG